MANYLYNGVELPKLPEVEGYDHKVVVKFHGDGMIRVYFSKLPFTVTEILDRSEEYYDEYLCNDAECISYFVYPNNQYTEKEWEYDTTDSTLRVDVYYFTPFWSNHDILKEDGTLFLAASEPVLVGIAPEIDPLSMTLGWLIGRRIAGQRGEKPVAYLYNGVRLPALPEYDKEKYPYAVMYKVELNGEDMYYAYALTKESYLLREISGSTGKEWMWLKGVAPYLRTVCGQNSGWDGLFSESVGWDYIDSTLSDAVGYNGETTKPFIWANHDVLETDGTIYFSKCGEPVPIYE